MPELAYHLLGGRLDALVDDQIERPLAAVQPPVGGRQRRPTQTCTAGAMAWLQMCVQYTKAATVGILMKDAHTFKVFPDIYS